MLKILIYKYKVYILGGCFINDDRHLKSVISFFYKLPFSHLMLSESA